MVYDWPKHEATCFQLYVEENMSLEQVMRVMKEKFDFDPSKRAYQQQFKRWNFPTKHHPAHENGELVERIRQLWEKNTSQKETLRILQGEGFQISDRGMMRVRAKNGWLLRVPKKTPNKDVPSLKRKRDEEKDVTPIAEAVQAVAGTDEQGNDGEVSYEDLAAATGGSESTDMKPPAQHNVDAITLEIEHKRQERLEKMQSKSDELYKHKKRRRRTRGYAGLPADPPAPPRFPSETTLDESKAYLHMDNERYQDVRDHFQRICEAAGFIKKTEAGPDAWQSAKNKLVAENAHLNKQFNGPFDGVQLENKALALDVVCTDVTKRMRTLERRITIAEAKNILGLNPEQSRDVRNAFHDILVEDRFTGKLGAADEHWKVLQRRWIDESEVLTNIHSLACEEGDSEYQQKKKALNILSQDVMKRLRDEQNKSSPEGKTRQIHDGPGPGPAGPRFARSPEVNDDEATGSPVVRPTRGIPAAPKTGRPSMPDRRTSRDSRARPTATQAANTTNLFDQDQDHDHIQIDPTLLATAADNTSSTTSLPLPLPTPTQDETSVASQLRAYAVSAAAGTGSNLFTASNTDAPIQQRSPQLDVNLQHDGEQDEAG